MNHQPSQPEASIPTANMRVAYIIAGAMLFSVMQLLLVLHFALKKSLPETTPEAQAFHETLRNVFFLMSLGAISLSFFLKKFLREKVASVTKQILLQRLHTAMVVSLALCESVAILGFCLAIITRNISQAYPFLAAGFIFMLAHVPRRTEWEEYFSRKTSGVNVPTN